MKKLIVAGLALLAIQFAVGSAAQAHRHHRHHIVYASPVYYGNGYGNGYYGNGGRNYRNHGNGRGVSARGGGHWN